MDSWESENKDIIKKRLWGTMSKKRGHDRRSEKSKLLYHQVYQSCQYVFVSKKKHSVPMLIFSVSFS